MSKMRVVQVPNPNGPFEIVEREIPEPGIVSVRIKIQACGICHSDSMGRDLTNASTEPAKNRLRPNGNRISIETLGMPINS